MVRKHSYASRQGVSQDSAVSASAAAERGPGPVREDPDHAAAAEFLRRVAERCAINRVGNLRVKAAGGDLGRLDEVAGVVAGIAVQVRASGTAVFDAGGLTEAQRYQVSAVLEKARERARDMTAPAKVAGVLAGVISGWDKAAGVTERAPSIRGWIAAGRPGGVVPRDLGA